MGKVDIDTSSVPAVELNIGRDQAGFQGRGLVQEANNIAQPRAEVGGGLVMVKSIQA